VCSGVTAPSNGAIHDVVVKQGKGVQQLECSTGVNGSRVVTMAARADEPPIGEHRS